jgi:hypothetical protein
MDVLDNSRRLLYTPCLEYAAHLSGDSLLNCHLDQFLVLCEFALRSLGVLRVGLLLLVLVALLCSLDLRLELGQKTLAA